MDTDVRERLLIRALQKGFPVAPAPRLMKMADVLKGFGDPGSTQTQDEQGRFTSGSGDSTSTPTKSGYQTTTAPAPGDKAWLHDQDGGGLTGRALMEAVMAPESLSRSDEIMALNAEHLDEATHLQFESETNGLPKGVWTEERQLEQQPILDAFAKSIEDVPEQRIAVIMGGLPGAGKSTFLEGTARDLGFEVDDFAIINPDDFKADLADAGMAPTPSGLDTSEATGFVHEESSYLAGQAMDDTMATGKNIIYDYTMGSENSVNQKIQELVDAGYEVHTVFMDTTPAESLARADARFATEGTYEGRFAHFEMLASTGFNDEGHSANREAFESTRTNPSVSSATLVNAHGEDAFIVGKPGSIFGGGD